MAQEVFVKVHARFDTLDAERPIRPWLFAFARNVAANHVRLARHRELPSEDVGNTHPGATNPEADARRAQARERILTVLAAMSFERRSVIVMHELDGFSAPEIAEVLGVPTNTVYSRIRLARTELREKLRELRPGVGK